MALLAPFLLVPVVELLVFILVCFLVGFATAFGLLLAGCLGGALLLRSFGLARLQQARQQRAGGPSGAPPSKELWLAAAGVVLLIPGFVTDLLALALLVPPLRRRLGRSLFRRQWPQKSRPAGAGRGPASPEPPPPMDAGIPPGPIIDVEFEDLPPAPPPRP